MVFKGVFFDLYGTLLVPKNNKKAWENWFNTFYKFMKSHGLDLTEKEFSNACKEFFDRPEPTKNQEDITVYENRINTLAIDLNVKLEKSEIKEIADATVNAWLKHVIIDPETIPILDDLKDKKTLALVTNFDHQPSIYTVLSKYQITKYFKFIAISGELGVKKPNPKIFHITLKKVGLIPEEVVFIGDSSEDIEGATKAGIKPILIQRQKIKRILTGNDYFSKKVGKNPKKDNLGITPWKIISNLRDLYEIVFL
ncbi:MAG: HAD family hydrolase [Candidatus Odinarchaeota archaeon]